MQSRRQIAKQTFDGQMKWYLKSHTKQALRGVEKWHRHKIYRARPFNYICLINIEIETEFPFLFNQNKQIPKYTK